VSLPAPDLATSVSAVFRISWTRLLRGRKLLLGAAATLIIVVGATLTRYLAEDSDPVDVMETAVQRGFFGMLAYLLPFLFASGAISEEVESRTFSFLAVRPTGRFALTIGKWLASVALACAILAIGLVVLHVAIFATEPSEMIDRLGSTARILGSLTLLMLAYSAICLFWGALVVEAAGVLAGLHLAFLEFAIGTMPGPFRFGSMNYMAQQLAGLPKIGFRPDWVPDIETWICGVVVGAITGLFLTLAIVVVESSEFGYGKA
jgi:ABC-type transport system involved in multi-copper enzyme maturation permease subunit